MRCTDKQKQCISFSHFSTFPNICIDICTVITFVWVFDGFVCHIIRSFAVLHSLPAKTFVVLFTERRLSVFLTSMIVHSDMTHEFFVDNLVLLLFFCSLLKPKSYRCLAPKKAIEMHLKKNFQSLTFVLDFGNDVFYKDTMKNCDHFSLLFQFTRNVKSFR